MTTITVSHQHDELQHRDFQVLTVQRLEDCCEVGNGYCRLIATTDLANLQRLGVFLYILSLVTAA